MIDGRSGGERADLDNVLRLRNWEIREGIERSIEVYRAMKIRRSSDGIGFFVTSGQLQMLVWWGFSMHARTQRPGRGREIS